MMGYLNSAETIVLFNWFKPFLVFFEITFLLYDCLQDFILEKI